MVAGVSIEAVIVRDEYARRAIPAVVAIGGSVILSDPQGLTPNQICLALMTSGHASLVCYGVDYLAAMIVPADLDCIRDIWAGYRVDIDGWRIELQAGRVLWIRRNGVGLMISDVRKWSPGGFPDLQHALGLHELAPVDRWDFDRIELARDAAVAQSLALVDVAERLEDACGNVGLPRYWRDGPGRIAGAVLDKIASASDITRFPRKTTPVIYAGYHGGRIEQLAAGVFPDIVQLDLRSAYPWAMTQLPSMNRGRWHYRAEYDPGAVWGVWSVSWDIPDGIPVGPFPVRFSDDGTVFPRTGRGWYWSPEVAAALDLFPGMVTVDRGIVFTPGDDVRPFAQLADLYGARAEARGNGAMAEAYVLKLVLNAAYGRLAQERLPDGTPGRWANIAQAGMLTSLVRARILRAAYEVPGPVLQIHTDSVTYAGRELSPAFPPGDELGGWSITTGQDALILPSGAYHCAAGDAQMDRVAGLPIEYQRAVDWAVIRNAWQSYGMLSGTVSVAGLSWHDIKFPVFVGIGQAATDSAPRYRQWLRSPWDLIGSPRAGMIASHDKANRGNFSFRPAPLPEDAVIRSYRPQAGLVPRRDHQRALTVGHAIRANDQPTG